MTSKKIAIEQGNLPLYIRILLLNILDLPCTYPSEGLISLDKWKSFSENFRDFRGHIT